MDRQSRCEDVSELLALYYYGELTDTKARALEAHVADCGQCARELEETRRVLGLVSPGLPGQAESARARASVMDRISGSRPGLLRRFAPAFVAAAAAAAVALVVNYTGFFNAPITNGTRPVQVQQSASVDMELLENYDMLSELDMLEDLDAIENMEEL